MKTTRLFLFVFLSASLFGQNVYIPDANFKADLLADTLINTNGDTVIQVSEASVFDGFINCGALGISDLTGIESFTALTELYCSYNLLTSLDVSQNTALSLLGCADNLLTTLDVSQNSALEGLGCSSNQLSSLDVSQNVNLEELYCNNNQLNSLNLNGADALSNAQCFENQLTSLDVSQNNALVDLDLGFNQLTSIDVSQNTDLMILNCNNNQLTCLNVANADNINFYGFYAMANPNLTCIEVDDVGWSTANWTIIDPQTSFSEDCNNDCTLSLTELNTSKNLIQILDLMGRETSFKPNTPLIYVYDDGSTEKVFSVEY